MRVALQQDTIVAPATPPGEGGIGIIRLSGSCAEEYLLRYFHPAKPAGKKLQTHYLHYGRLKDAGGGLVDEVMAVIMRRPYSYTREDVVEVHCHGGPLVVRRILDLFLDAGARLARPGEFTLRAFLNGRLDLSQAEAVIDLIRSGSEAANRLALRQLEGRLSVVVHRFRDQLADLLSLVEAHIDFPEEEIDLPASKGLEQTAANVLEEIERLLAGFDCGRILREGMAVLILGRPNVGKSSLLNALLGESRAIVTEVAGTTRDTIEESTTFGGIPLRLVDTAGIRHTSDPVEEEGMRRARQKAAAADLVLLVIDGSSVPSEEDLLALQACGDGPTLLVVNKADLCRAVLPEPFSLLPYVRISAKTGEGLDVLEKNVVQAVTSAAGSGQVESVLVSDRRHREALLRARDSLSLFIQGLAGGLGCELLAMELRDTLQALGEITGETAADDILDRIFTRFCIGK